MTKIKICGLSREADVEYVNEARPDFCGFIINYPKSKRNVSPDTVRRLSSGLSDGIQPVGVFVNENINLVASLLRDGTLFACQLHGNEDEDYISRLRCVTDKPIIKAFRVKSRAELDLAAVCTADFVLLDSGAGSGVTFDWSLLSGFPRPYFLAGGLNDGNIAAALDTLHPYAVDISSGVETDGVKDRDKILRAVAAVRKNNIL
ncbi:MAG: phosphoribosylanthranilate isomerase [Firmicutes bacterium]|nr:phosphoribosylanthranilate isomerase [Bacillota bacterium]